MIEALIAHQENIQTQAEWEVFLNGEETPLRHIGYTDEVFAAHREVFRRSFPNLPVRELYPIESAPKYTGLVGENSRKIHEQMITPIGRDDALVIGASGANLLLALLAEYKHIDVIDLSESQIGWCYALIAFIILTKPEDLLQRLGEFRQSQYFLDDYFSMQLPSVRADYLQQIPDVIDYLGIPERYHKMVYRGLELESMTVLEELIRSIDDFFLNYSAIRRRLITGKRLNFIVGNIFEHLEGQLGSYDVIASSNVFEWSERSMSLEDFCRRMVDGLRQGGVANAHSIRGLDIQNLSGDFSVLRFEPCKLGEWNNNWLLIQKK